MAQIERGDVNRLNKQKYSEYYLFEKLLGQGAFCQVYQAIDQKSGERVAVKVVITIY
jgi:serine/threonine protein kinase